MKLADIKSIDRPEQPAGDIGHTLGDVEVVPPSISIVVTSYNYERYLCACLESIARQDYEDFECVIVDDASTDGSVEIISQFIDSDVAKGRFRLLQHDENKGQMHGFMTGLKNTKGTFVVFVDADDVLLSDFLEAHLKAHLNGSYAVAFTCSNQLQIDERGEIVAGTDPMILFDRGGYDKRRLDGLPERITWQMGQGRPIRMKQDPQPYSYLPAFSGYFISWFWSTTSAMMYRRATLEMIMPEDCSPFRICADYYLVTFCHAIGGSLVISTVHGCHRRHGENAFSQNPVVGGEYAPRNRLTHPSYETYNRSFVEHVVKNFDRTVALLGRRQTILLIARFAPKNLFLKLWRDAPWLGRRTLLKHRVLWKLVTSFERKRFRIRFFLRLFKS